ncbi:hypothetical protein FOB31_23375 [Burkholderia multivorans]|nr:hypothetical protein FOB31_23375 [Burkholderia multivorans]QET37504.1 hypothetical protein FOB30_07200 [Burkholderia multivorans]
MPAIINELRRRSVRKATAAAASISREANRQIENATNPEAQTYTKKNFASSCQKWSRVFSE